MKGTRTASPGETSTGDAGVGIRETLCTLGNGYFATRGARAEAADDGVHYPGSYLAGVHDPAGPVLVLAAREFVPGCRCALACHASILPPMPAAARDS